MRVYGFLLICMGGCIVPSKGWNVSDEAVGVPSKSKKPTGCRGLLVGVWYKNYLTIEARCPIMVVLMMNDALIRECRMCQRRIRLSQINRRNHND